MDRLRLLRLRPSEPALLLVVGLLPRSFPLSLLQCCEDDTEGTPRGKGKRGGGVMCMGNMGVFSLVCIVYVVLLFI